MKRFVLFISVLGIFLIYSFSLRHQSVGLILRPSKSNPNSGSSNSSNSGSGNSGSIQYKDGTYTGSPEDAFYGNVQISATINNGHITSVKFLQFPNDRSTSVAINQQAIPLLQQEAIRAQSASVDIISGATFTSQAFAQSLATALSQAQI